MVSLSAGARKWGDCTRVWVETVVTATVKQSNSTAVLLPPPLPSEGKWLPETWTGAFIMQCHNSCYFMLALLPKAPKTKNLSAILEFGSSIHLVIALESVFWMNILKNNWVIWKQDSSCGFIHWKSWLYLGNVLLDTIQSNCLAVKKLPEAQLWAVMWLLSVQVVQLSWALWVAETMQYIDISTH